MAAARPRGTAVQLQANARVVITEWRLPPGAETGWHLHPRDDVVVYRTDAKHIVETRGGIGAADVPAGRAYFRAGGVEHNVINAGPFEVVWIKTELL